MLKTVRYAEKKNININRYSDLGTDELAKQKGRVIVQGIDGVKRAYVKKTSPLNYYLQRNVINLLQYEAGTRLYEIYYKGVVSQFPKTISGYKMPCGGGGKPDFDNKTSLFYGYYRKAMDIFDTPEQIILNHVCCEEKSLNKLFKPAKIPDKKKKLQELLTKLAKHLGIIT